MVIEQMKRAYTILIVSFLIPFHAAAIAAGDQVQKTRKLYQKVSTETRPYYYTITLRQPDPFALHDPENRKDR